MASETNDNFEIQIEKELGCVSEKTVRWVSELLSELHDVSRQNALLPDLDPTSARPPRCFKPEVIDHTLARSSHSHEPYVIEKLQCQDEE